MTSQEAIETIEANYPPENYSMLREALDMAIALLKERGGPKTGHWIDSAGDDKCSVCGATYSDLYPDYSHTHYCPNCGSKNQP